MNKSSKDFASTARKLKTLAENSSVCEPNTISFEALKRFIQWTIQTVHEEKNVARNWDIVKPIDEECSLPVSTVSAAPLPPFVVDVVPAAAVLPSEPQTKQFKTDWEKCQFYLLNHRQNNSRQTGRNVSSTF